ncbi:MAG: deoxyribonuclease IV [Anaerolineae bacterium]
MRLGAHVSIAGGADLAIERGTEFGCEAIQIFTKNNNQWRAAPLADEVVERFRANLAASDIHPVVAHGSYLINLGTSDQALWKKSSDSLQTELERCERLGVAFFVTHPGSHTGAGIEPGLANVARALNAVHKRTHGYRVMTLVEHMAGQGTNLCSAFDQIARLFDMVEDQTRIGVCLDTCHLFAAGYDYRTPDKYAALMEEMDRAFGLDRVRCIHLNDSKTPLGSRVDRHERIGQGKIGRKGFKLFVQDPRWRDTPGLIETPTDGTGKQEKQNLRTLRRLAAG